jgi:hypothetical protein
MRALMGLIKDRHGTYYARRKVPERLQGAVARILDKDEARQVWLKKSLGTKVLAEANVRAKPVLMGFDRVFAQAEAQLKERPLRTTISDAEIKRIADYFYAHELAADEELRVDGRGDDPLFASVHRQLTEAGVQFTTPYDLKSLTLEPGRGLSPRMMQRIGDTAADMLAVAEDELARGDTTHIRYEVDALLQTFQINLDRSCEGYRKLARAVLAAHVRELRDVLARIRVSLSKPRRYRKPQRLLRQVKRCRPGLRGGNVNASVPNGHLSSTNGQSGCFQSYTAIC